MKSEPCQIRRVEIRLRNEGLGTGGDCMFVAIAWSAGIPIDPFAVRQQVCSYLAFPQMFSLWFGTKWPSCESYLQALRRPGVW